ncbi:MAG: DnaJ C-terminal domain-containing protein [Candidatus Thalassarchaeaceae archaeon]|jgi:DnaJ-class molecular chaperone|nr:DnaJ C-terminal domain-containing protein [Candidatus Thalassarchaeaceae archaeon]
MAGDPYQTLGVSKDAPHAEIKRSFRRLARQYHPDRNPNDAAAEERFKAIQSAWEQVETPEKRSQYDEEQEMKQAFGGMGGMPGGMGGMDLGDMLRQFMGADSRHSSSPFGQQSRRSQVQPETPKGADMTVPLDIDFEKAMEGGKVQFTVNRLRRCDECKARGCIHCNNLGVRRRKSKFTIDVPKGASHGQQLKLPKMGNEHPSGEPGNLTVTLRIDADEGRRWEGNHLIQEVPVPYSTLILGGKIRITTPAGNTVSLSVAPETRIGDRKRLPKQGFAGGDLDIEFILMELESISDEQREVLKSLQKEGL